MPSSTPKQPPTDERENTISLPSSQKSLAPFSHLFQLTPFPTPYSTLQLCLHLCPNNPPQASPIRLKKYFSHNNKGSPTILTTICLGMCSYPGTAILWAIYLESTTSHNSHKTIFYSKESSNPYKIKEEPIKTA